MAVYTIKYKNTFCFLLGERIKQSDFIHSYEAGMFVDHLVAVGKENKNRSF